jgi:hypothetical protein
VRSYLEAEEESEGLIEQWEVELLTSSPVYEGSVTEPEETAAAE